MKGDSCYNCSYNCCCRCDNPESCYQCKSFERNQQYYDEETGIYKINRSSHLPRCTDRGRYSTHYVCFDCRIGWKDYYIRTWRFEWKNIEHNFPKNAQGYYITSSGEPSGTQPRCKKCGKGGTPMGENFRVPKQKDKKAWEMAKFITQDLQGILDQLGDLEEEQPSFLKIFILKRLGSVPTLAKQFTILKYKFQTNHIFRPLGNQLRLSYPKHKREIPEFIHTLRSTILHQYNPWYILRKYIQMRAIARYWRKLGRLRRIKDNAAYTIMYAWHRYSYSTPGSYHYEKGVKEYEEVAEEVGWN